MKTSLRNLLIASALCASIVQAQVQKAFPKHWGEPPQIQTRDFRPLPNGYGSGSSTLANWIQANLDKDAAKGNEQYKGAAVSGELKQWHKITLTFDGPQASETDNNPNPFTDYRFFVLFIHEDGQSRFDVPGYFAVDGNAANTGAMAGNKWRVHLSPDKAGKWNYIVSFTRGKDAALAENPTGEFVENINGLTGSFVVAPSDKTGRDMRAKGRLQYVGKHLSTVRGQWRIFLKSRSRRAGNFIGL